MWQNLPKFFGWLVTSLTLNIWQIFILLLFHMTMKKKYVQSCPTSGGVTSDIYLFCFKPYRGAQWQEFKINYWQKLSLLGSFVKGAAVPIQKHLFIASAFMEINNWCLGWGIYMLRPCLNCSNLKTSCKVSISQKNWCLFKTVLT